MRNNSNPTIIAHIIDYDGCATAGARALREHIVDLAQEYPNAISILMVGSYRQTIDIDWLGECENPAYGSCFQFFEDFLTEIHEKYPNLIDRIKLDKFLLEDIHHNTPAGTHFDKAKQLTLFEKRDRHIDKKNHIHWHDYAKYASTYAQIHHLAMRFPGKCMKINIYDDRVDIEAPILLNLYRFYHKNKSYLPHNTELQLHHYHKISEPNGRMFGDFCNTISCHFCHHAFYLDPIKGEGTVDVNYHETVQLIGSNQEKRISHALHLQTEKHGLHSVIQFIMLNIPENMRAILFDHLIVIAIEKNNLRAIKHLIETNGKNEAFMQNIFVVACFQNQLNTARLFASFANNLSAHLARHLIKGENWQTIEKACSVIMEIQQSTAHSNVAQLFDLLPFAVQHKQPTLAHALISAAIIEEKERVALRELVKIWIVTSLSSVSASAEMFQATLQIIHSVVTIEEDLSRLQLYSHALPNQKKEFSDEVLLVLLYLCSKDLKKPINSMSQLFHHLFFAVMAATNHVQEIKKAYFDYSVTLEQQLNFYFEQAHAYLFALHGVYPITKVHETMLCDFINSQLPTIDQKIVEEYVSNAIKASSTQPLDSEQKICCNLIGKLRQQENASNNRTCRLSHHALRCALLYAEIDSPDSVRHAITQWKDAINPRAQKPHWEVLAEEDERSCIVQSHARFINNLPNTIAEIMAQATPPIAAYAINHR